MLAITVTGENDRRFLLTAAGPGPAARLDEFRRVLSIWSR